MTRNDAIMSILAHCNKLRDGMIKEGNPDVETYRQIEKIEALCLSDVQTSTGRGIEAAIPSTQNGLEGVGRV